MNPGAGALSASGGLEMIVVTEQRSGSASLAHLLSGSSMSVSTSSLGPRIIGLPNIGEASMDELLQNFDPAYRLSKLSFVYNTLKARVTTFDEAFKVCSFLLSS